MEKRKLNERWNNCQNEKIKRQHKKKIISTTPPVITEITYTHVVACIILTDDTKTLPKLLDFCGLISLSEHKYLRFHLDSNSEISFCGSDKNLSSRCLATEPSHLTTLQFESNINEKFSIINFQFSPP